MDIAALYVEKDGAYYGIDGVDPWDMERDARLYDGSCPVVAHPPCNRWSKLATFRGQRDGNDGGCFEAALEAVRTCGGVLEHPAHSLAWARFWLPKPDIGGGWKMRFDGWASCWVDQAWYGHEANKPTWLLAYGCDLPALISGRAPSTEKTIQNSYGGGKRQARRSATPPAFRDILIGMARSVEMVNV